MENGNCWYGWIGKNRDRFLRAPQNCFPMLVCDSCWHYWIFIDSALRALILYQFPSCIREWERVEASYFFYSTIFLLHFGADARLPKFPISRRSNAPSNKIQRGIINYCLAPSGAHTHTYTKTQRETSRSRIIRVNCCKHVHCRPPVRSQSARLILSVILIIICQLVQKIACLPEATEDDVVEQANRRHALEMEMRETQRHY